MKKFVMVFLIFVGLGLITCSCKDSPDDCKKIIINDTVHKSIALDFDLGTISTLGKKKYTIPIINETNEEFYIYDIVSSCGCTIAEVSKTICSKNTIPLHFYYTPPNKKEKIKNFISLKIKSDNLNEIRINIFANIEPLIDINPGSIKFTVPMNYIQSATAVISKNYSGDIEIDKIFCTLDGIELSTSRLILSKEKNYITIVCQSKSKLGNEYGEIQFFSSLHSEPIGKIKVFRSTRRNVITIPQKTVLSPFNSQTKVERIIGIKSMNPEDKIIINSLRSRHPLLQAEIFKKPNEEKFKLVLLPNKKSESFKTKIEIDCNRGVFYHPVSVNYYSNK
jgi:Protein of unknown function (DUF1573)